MTCYNGNMGRGLKWIPAGILGALLLSCEPLAPDPNSDPNPIDSGQGTAQLTITNSVTHYPGTYGVLLFNVSATDVLSSFDVDLGDVAENGVQVVNVAAGRWKIGVTLPDGTRFPLLSSLGSTTWVVVAPIKGGKYALDLLTDGGGNNFWSTDIPRE